MALGRQRGTRNAKPGTGNRQPGLNVLVKIFLLFELRGDDHDGTAGEKMPQQRGQKRLRGLADAAARQCAALLQAPLQGLHGGSLRDGGKKIVCHRT